MGFAPAQIGAMSFWQFMACCDGFRAFHSSEDASAPISDEDADIAAALLDNGPQVMH